MMDYVAFCKNFFAATNIPINLLKDSVPQYSTFGDLLSLPPQKPWELWPIEAGKNPAFCGYSSDIEYGRIHVEGTDYDVIVGPTFSVPITDKIVREFAHELEVPFGYREQFTELLSAIPRTSQHQFAKYLSFLYLCLNQKEANTDDLYEENELLIQSRKQNQLENMLENMENEFRHNTYQYELEMFQYIKEGNPEKLKNFFASHKLLLKEGKLAHSPIRQAKNIFLSTITKIEMLAAIPGGLDVEKTYQLVDLYIQECEQLQTIEEINSLQYHMVMDFCQRLNDVQMPEGISPDVYHCMNFIRSHTNEPIGVDDVAAHVHRSSSYMMKCFKKELGIQIGAFITRCKLEEAKSMLTYSNKTLAEISSYLCFSSQSYFQNLFKKQYGVTPMQYRKQSQTKTT